MREIAVCTIESCGERIHYQLQLGDSSVQFQQRASMEIAFCSQELRALFESAKAMRMKFGTDAADAIMTLLSELRAADSVDDLIDVDISAAPQEPNSVFLSANDKIRMKIEANHATIPVDRNGAIAWNRVFMIKILDVRNGC